MELKIGQRVKYKEEYLVWRPSEDKELSINEYTILAVKEDRVGYIYRKDNKRRIGGDDYKDFTWFVGRDEVEPLKQAVHCKTKEEFKAVLEYIESLGIGAEWHSGHKPTQFIDYWDEHKDQIYLDISDLLNIGYGADKKWYEDENYSIITAQEYLRDWKGYEGENTKISEITSEPKVEPTNQTNNKPMNKLTAKIIRTFSKDDRELYKAGFVNDNNKPTQVLRDMIADDLIEKYLTENKKVYVELAKEVNKEK